MKRRWNGQLRAPLHCMADDMWSIICQYLCCHDMANLRTAGVAVKDPPFIGQAYHSHDPDRRALVIHAHNDIGLLNVWGGVHVLYCPSTIFREVVDNDLCNLRDLHILGTRNLPTTCFIRHTRRVVVHGRTAIVKLLIETNSTEEIVAIGGSVYGTNIEIQGDVSSVKSVDAFDASLSSTEPFFGVTKASVWYQHAHMFPNVEDLTVNLTHMFRIATCRFIESIPRSVKRLTIYANSIEEIDELTTCNVPESVEDIHISLHKDYDPYLTRIGHIIPTVVLRDEFL